MNFYNLGGPNQNWYLIPFFHNFWWWYPQTLILSPMESWESGFSIGEKISVGGHHHQKLWPNRVGAHNLKVKSCSQEEIRINLEQFYITITRCENNASYSWDCLSCGACQSFLSLRIKRYLANEVQQHDYHSDVSNLGSTKRFLAIPDWFNTSC